MAFEWDADQADLNWRNHGVAFEVAALVFDGQLRIEDDDPEPSEYRQNVIGYVDGRPLFVVFTMRGDVCRIISARVGDRKERRRYHEDSRD